MNDGTVMQREALLAILTSVTKIIAVSFLYSIILVTNVMKCFNEMKYEKITITKYFYF